MEINIDGSVLSYKKEGIGKRHLLLFHGFGQDCTLLEPIVQQLSNQYTCYSFDLFFHGKSTWIKGEKPLEKGDWMQFLHTFLEKEKIEKFSLLGYSIGAKFTLATAEAFPQMTDELFLIAPDGIKINPWYRIATSFLVRKLFKITISRPGFFFTLVKLCKSLRLVDAQLLWFAMQQMSSESKRRKVYYSWVVFRKFKFETGRLAQLLNQHAVRTVIILGRQDKLIQTHLANDFIKQVKNIQVEILNIGHNALLKNCADILRTGPS